jgi:AraC-like DNA-binding protein/mannose-6-phosphate isomerase-like protein (cupin superfamily)
MPAHKPRALYQAFMPDSAQRAFVWKYAEAVGGKRPRHFHREPELNLVVRGSATFGVGSRVVRLSAGELLAFPAGQDHALLEASQDLYLYAIGLDPALSTEVLGTLSEPVVPMHVRLAPDELAAVSERAASILDRFHVPELGAELWERVHCLGRRGTPCDGRAPHVLTRRTLKLLEGEPELGLDALARELRTHPSEISRHFHRDVGIPLARYRTRLRLLGFIRLLDIGELDLTRAASIAGFGSYSQCHRTFQSELGCAPRKFVSEIREQMQLTYAS